MIDITFLKALRSKLKGGNARSIHLNVLPGRFAARLDICGLDVISSHLNRQFLDCLLNKASFEFKISFDHINLTTLPDAEKKRLGLLSKRLNSLSAENEDNFKEHGIKTFGFGFPIIIKRSRLDLTKLIKAPLLIWNLDIQKSPNKINAWSIFRNKVRNEQGKMVDEDIHTVTLNDVLLSSIKTDENITIPQIEEEMLADSVIDEYELLRICENFLESLNAHSITSSYELRDKFNDPLKEIPDSKELESITGDTPWIYFGGVFGLYRTQKESIITDIDKLIGKYDEFAFENLKAQVFAATPFSAVQTDPSQQNILANLCVEKKQIIQGPPGTGKSQSLTALLTNALANNLKCLVVCEKKTALDVIRQNLHSRNDQLGALAAVIEDISKDREGVVGSVRERINNMHNRRPFNPYAYQTAKKTMEDCAARVNGQHRKLDEHIYQGKKWTQLVGQYLSASKTGEPALLKNRLDFKHFRFNSDSYELKDILQALRDAQKLYSRINTLKHPLSALHDDVLSEANVMAASLRVENFCEYIRASVPGLQKQVNEQLALCGHWGKLNASVERDCLKKLIVNWQAFLSGNYTGTAGGLPDPLPIEDNIHDLAVIAHELQGTIAMIEKDYASCLAGHYNEHYETLKKEVTDYLAFIQEHSDKLGSYFLRDDKMARMITSVLGIFSGNYKAIVKTKPGIVEKIESIKNVHNEFDYFKHAFIDETGIEDLTVYIENITTFDGALEEWHKGSPLLVQGYVSNIHAGNLHPAFPGVNDVQLVEKTYRHLTSTAIKDFGIPTGTQSSPTFQTVNGASELIIGELNVLSKTVDSLKAFYIDYKTGYDNITTAFSALQIYHQGEHILKKALETPAHLAALLENLQELLDESIEIQLQLGAFRDYYNWRKFFITQTPLQQEVITAVIESGCKDWGNTFESWYLNWLLSVNENDALPTNSDHIGELFNAQELFSTMQLAGIADNWASRQQVSLQRTRLAGINATSLFNKKGSKGEKRNSMRKIIQADFELFTDFFPVLMVNPGVCSSIVPLAEGIFDLVIFDEASQLRLEDTFAALIRGKIRIVSGDSQQMPPSSYFMGSNAVLNPEEDEEEMTKDEADDRQRKTDHSIELAESESLLVYAENAGYKQSYLKIHYRSKHPALIDFSNHAFYGQRLMPMPARTEYTPVQYIEVNGLYDESVNREEAKKVVELLLFSIAPLANGEFPSVGVATFNLYQRNLILDEITRARQMNPEHDKKFSALDKDLFVKNLENIQGDERDIIILSTTFGRKKDGSFSQHFGPIIQRNGYKLLNVIITRARMKIFICTSIPAEQIKQYPVLLTQMKNNGRAVLYAYLAYAKAIAEGNINISDGILKQLYDNCDFKAYQLDHDSLGSESPFEDEVYYRLCEKFGQHRIAQQYKIGGFRIDIVILSEQTGQPFIAIECDGAKYHSSNEAYAWDMFRQQHLEKFGFTFHRIWSTNWWYSPDTELSRIVDFVRQADNREWALKG